MPEEASMEPFYADGVAVRMTATGSAYFVENDELNARRLTAKLNEDAARLSTTEQQVELEKTGREGDNATWRIADSLLRKQLATAEQQAQTLREQEVYWRRRVHSLRAEAQTLRAALVRYGRHEWLCDRSQTSNPDSVNCTCGLDAALNPQSVGASDEADAELAAEPRAVAALNRLIAAVETTDFDYSKVKRFSLEDELASGAILPQEGQEASDG
jgi:hypothetical protein